MRRALVLGVSGQDGSYLAELLLSKGYEVHGLVHENTGHSIDGVRKHTGDICDEKSIHKTFKVSTPDEVYNFVSPGRVNNIASAKSEAIGLAVARLLEALPPGARFFQACSSEMFGPSYAPQREETPLRPQSPYGIAKAYAFYTTAYYRRIGVHASSAIFYNHESPRRSAWSVSRKIAAAAAGAKRGGKQERLVLGNIDAKRDWGFAGDYARAAWLMLQQEKPDDYVIAPGKSHSVRDFLDAAFAYAGAEWDTYVTLDPARYGPTETHELRGDVSKARRALGWLPTVTFEEMVHAMVDAELERAR